jgi:hypothetical protein
VEQWDNLELLRVHVVDQMTLICVALFEYRRTGLDCGEGSTVKQARRGALSKTSARRHACAGLGARGCAQSVGGLVRWCEGMVQVMDR